MVLNPMKSDRIAKREMKRMILRMSRELA